MCFRNQSFFLHEILWLVFSPNALYRRLALLAHSPITMPSNFNWKVRMRGVRGGVQGGGKTPYRILYRSCLRTLLYRVIYDSG